ncbi:hypothetical protein J2799_004644 [Chryseobacterium vietnamense]|nr:hypothetical protein [Chryseobacterium vietnamense]
MKIYWAIIYSIGIYKHRLIIPYQPRNSQPGLTITY